jgi:hypothetical protein
LAADSGKHPGFACSPFLDLPLTFFSLALCQVTGGG